MRSAAIEAAERSTLPSVSALLWRAYGDGKVTEAEAEALSGLIEARTDAPALRRMPHAVRTPSEAVEVVGWKDCRLSVPNVAAVTGVAETTVRNAIREARRLGLLTVEERQITGFRNDTNIVRIISPEWTA